jgi:hypothetical protein
MTGFKRVVYVAGLGAAALTIAGCCTTGPKVRAAGGASPAAGPSLSKGDLLGDVKVIVITSDQQAHPEKQCVRAGIQVVVWVADTNKLGVTFDAAKNPFSQQPTCPGGRFCYSILPPPVSTPEGEYEYNVVLARVGGTPVILDPRIEIMH